MGPPLGGGADLILGGVGAVVGADAPGLSATTVRRLKAVWQQEDEAWSRRLLAGRSWSRLCLRQTPTEWKVMMNLLLWRMFIITYHSPGGFNSTTLTPAATR